jgi:hypothetical protein
MSTRSFIGYQHSTDEIRGMYCHYDGYPDHVGVILTKYHSSFAAMTEIISGGQIRNFDQDGTICRFGDDQAGELESYKSVQEALDTVFDYVYLFDEFNQEWVCYGKQYGNDGSVIVECEIPLEVA